ncbi:MAG: acyltransferase [Chloroflexota bacterium]
MNIHAMHEQGEKPLVGFRLGHRPSLDGLRGIFILLVVAIHAGVPFMPGAGLGVDLFFVLSGFLITCLLMQEWQQHSSISLKRFYIRRALRLLPALYVLLTLVGIIALVWMKGEAALATQRGVMLSFIYSSNWFTLLFSDYQIGLGLMGHSWSLAIEEQFYLVWPFVLIGLLSLRMSSRRLAGSVGLLMVSAVAWRLWLVISGGYDSRLFVSLDTRADQLLVGCFLGVLAAEGLVHPSIRGVRATRWLVVISAVVLTYLVADPAWYSSLFPFYGGFTLIALCAGALILHLIVSPQGRMSRLLAWQPLAQIGVVSYGIYLWHYPIFHLLPTGPAGWLDWPMQLVRLVMLALFVTASRRYVEKPMLRLKERLSSQTPAREQVDTVTSEASSAMIPHSVQAGLQD